MVWGYDALMRILLQNPRRETEIQGPKTVAQLLERLNLLPEAVLVIRGDELITEDEALKEEDTIEIRPVISGGSRSLQTQSRGTEELTLRLRATGNPNHRQGCGNGRVPGQSKALNRVLKNTFTGQAGQKGSDARPPLKGLPTFESSGGGSPPPGTLTIGFTSGGSQAPREPQRTGGVREDSRGAENAADATLQVALK